MVTPLSDYEMNLVTDAGVLLSKNKIIQKVIELFGGLCEDYKKVMKANDSVIDDETDAKISRGENYKSLPYVMLDYPRQFGKSDVFAIRTFFWWGNFFSITLQLSGQYQHKYSSAVKKAIDANLFEGWYFSCGDSAWEHHFENDNYSMIERDKIDDILNRPFLKIAKKIPLAKWDDTNCFFKEHFTFLIKVLAA